MPTIGTVASSTAFSGCSPNSHRNGNAVFVKNVAQTLRHTDSTAEKNDLRARFMRSPHRFGHVFDAAMKPFARLAFHKKRSCRSRRVLPDSHGDGAVASRAQIVRRDENLVRRKSDAAGICVCSNRCSSAAKNFWCASSQDFGLIQNQARRDRRNRAASIPSAERSASDTARREKLAVVREDEFLVQIFLKSFVAPALSRAAAPFAQHFAADDHVLHRQNIDVLHRTTRALIVEIEFADRIHAVAEKLDAHGISHQWRKHIDDSAANRKFSGRADRLLPQISRVREMFDQQLLRKIFAARDVQAVGVELRGRGKPRAMDRMEATTISTCLFRSRQSVVARACWMSAWGVRPA